MLSITAQARFTMKMVGFTLTRNQPVESGPIVVVVVTTGEKRFNPIAAPAGVGGRRNQTHSAPRGRKRVRGGW